jgi:hypothetical protein
MRTGTSGRRRAQCSTNSLHRTVDTFVETWIIILSCSSRGVVMGRREDGAAVRKGRRYAPSSPGRPSGETPPSADAALRAGGKRSLWHSGDGGAPLPGNRTRRQELADRRGWSTFSKARPVSRRTPLWSAGRRLSPHKGDRGRLRKASHRMVSPAIHRGSRTPPRLPALRSPRGSRDLQFGLRRTRRRSKNAGDAARPIVIPGRERTRNDSGLFDNRRGNARQSSPVILRCSARNAPSLEGSESQTWARLRATDPSRRASRAPW